MIEALIGNRNLRAGAVDPLLDQGYPRTGTNGAHRGNRLPALPGYPYQMIAVSWTCREQQLVILAAAYGPAQRVRTGKSCGSGERLDARQVLGIQARSHRGLLAEMGQIRGQTVGQIHHGMH